MSFKQHILQHLLIVHSWFLTELHYSEKYITELGNGTHLPSVQSLRLLTQGYAEYRDGLQTKSHQGNTETREEVLSAYRTFHPFST
jgi:hypothetical protein